MFDEVFDRAPVPQVVLDRDGRVVSVNARFAGLFGPCADLLAEEILSGASPGLLRLVMSLVTEGRRFEAKDLEVRLASGRHMNVDCYGSVMEDGERFHVLLVDSTEKVSQAASRIQRERGETIARFAGGLAHDLNNLLAAIVATAQAGAADAEEGAGDEGRIRRHHREAERGASLARSLRAIAFDESGGWRPVPLGVELRAAAAALARGPNPAPIAIDIADGVSDVIGDRSRLHQLVLNLLVNARDATLHSARDGEGIAVSLGPAPQGGVELVVADRVPASRSSSASGIFQPYFTTKRTLADAEAGPGWGAGLGLAIVDAVARATGATVSVADRAGGGAEFRVVWPPTAVVYEPADKPGEPANLVSPALVLLADNEVALVGAVARQLRRLGHSVYAAIDAEECRRLFEQYRDTIDVAVLDVKLGDGDGVRELAEFFRAQRPDLAIVLMSASRAALGSPDQIAHRWSNRSTYASSRSPSSVRLPKSVPPLPDRGAPV